MISNFITVKNADKEFVAYLKIADKYKNYVENSIKYFEIPTLLSCKQGKTAESRIWKFENICNILNSPALDLPIW